MSSPAPVIHCPACNHANPPDVRFCQMCGKKTVLPCRRCRTENALGVLFCKSCGVNLAEATLGITDERAAQWWDHFCEFPGFSQIWRSNGYGKTEVLPLAQDLLEASDPRALREDETTALFFPVADRDWCIRTVQFNTASITRGALWACTTAFAIFDFSRRIVHSVSYESLSRADRQGDAIILGVEPATTVNITFRVPRPSKAARNFWFISGIATAFSSQGAADSEAASRANVRRAQDYQEKLAAANGYAESMLRLLLEIIKIKTKLNGD